MSERDVSTFPGLDPAFRDITGRRAIAECIARRYMTPRGFLDYAPNDGFDVRSALSRAMSGRELATLRAEMTAEAEKDERVRSATVDVTVDLEAESIRARVELETAEGPFVLTLSIDKVTVEILSLV